MEIRRYKPGEEQAIWAVFYGSTRNIVSKDYTEAQVKRWAPDNKCIIEWSARLKAKNPFVAIFDNKVVGFAELESDGHIDCFYCHQDYQGQGVGSALIERLESEARAQELDALFAEVSVTAYPFFLAKGFTVTAEVENIVCEAPAKQYYMRKELV